MFADHSSVRSLDSDGLRTVRMEMTRDNFIQQKRDCVHSQLSSVTPHPDPIVDRPRMTKQIIVLFQLKNDTMKCMESQLPTKGISFQI